MVQLTPFHAALWWILTLGGFLNENRLGGLLRWFESRGLPHVAAGIASPLLNWHTVQAAHEELNAVQ